MNNIMGDYISKTKNTLGVWWREFTGVGALQRQINFLDDKHETLKDRCEIFIGDEVK